jgi:hypothetical protein
MATEQTIFSLMDFYRWKEFIRGSEYIVEFNCVLWVGGKLNKIWKNTYLGVNFGKIAFNPREWSQWQQNAGGLSQTGFHQYHIALTSGTLVLQNKYCRKRQ